MWLALFLGSWTMLGNQARADTIYDSPYVTFSPDSKAWTVQEGEEDVTHYPEGTTVNTGNTSSLRALHVGEHYYSIKRSGTIPIGKWVVEHRYAQCIHDSYPEEDYFHGVIYGKEYCLKYYNSGWIAYCADCGEQVKHMYVYMDKDAAKTIDFMECGVGLTYYHLCPFCTNLEQGAELKEHTCKQISWNRYKVIYEANTNGEAYSGYMNDSFHMYNNAAEYEGEHVTPVTRLTKNQYERIGYRFIGWNTKPDGSGKFYGDKEEILNLSTYDFKQDGQLAAVKLYAQWERTESTLQIDPAGGTYNGETGCTVITQEYGTRYTVDNSKVTAPKGYRVSFEANGGTAVEAITGTQHFTEWSQIQPFVSQLKNGVYTFVGESGNVDRLKANYEPDAITLPGVEKENMSFGGWYYDEAFTKPAGGAGDEIIPSKDITLYAQWVELRLYAKSNYVDNNKKGAVDLWWTQPDGQNKAYKLYQGLDAAEWKEVHAADDIGTSKQVQESFSYTGEVQRYTIPYTGLYSLTAYGAQGEGYGKCTGGKGGKVSGTFWLQKGDVITYKIGGQNGFGAGGKAKLYGCGGGSTRITSKQKGLLMVAGGGGGATLLSNGGSGGSAEGLRSNGKAAGADGHAGGGAGYVGGNAGEVVVHRHTAKCYQEMNVNLLKEYGAKLVTDERIPIEDDTDEGEEDYYGHKVLSIGSAENLIPVSEGASVKLQAWFEAYKYTKADVNGIYIYNQEGKLLEHYSEKELNNWVRTQTKAAEWGTYQDNKGFCDDKYTARLTHHYDIDGEYTDSDVYWLSWDADGKAYKNSVTTDDVDEAEKLYTKAKSQAEKIWYSEKREYNTNDVYGIEQNVFREKYTIPKGTTGIYIIFDIMSEQVWDDPYVGFDVAYLSGAKKLICGYKEGEVISSKPAYGGSNYINTDLCVKYGSEAGNRKGNGAFLLKSEDIGYLDVMQLNGVAAPDLAAPEAIQTEGEDDDEKPIKVEPVEGSNGKTVKVSWREPKDRGTAYYHKVESHMASTGSKLCTSNYTKNTLTTGVKGYYYVVDDYATTIVTEKNSFTGKAQPWVYVTLNTPTQYLHIAPVDLAGNLGETSHISLDIVVEWQPYTNPISIEGGDNVYPAEAANTWYVKADGTVPFQLQFSAYIEGNAAEIYQINQTIFESKPEGEAGAWNIVETPMSELQVGSVETQGSGLSFANKGAPILKEAAYTKTVRSNWNKEIGVVKDFVLEENAHGKLIRVTPRAAVVNSIYEVYSDEMRDRINGIYLIGDGEGPLIWGMDNLPGLIYRGKETVTLELEAEDEHSGVREFYVEIFNEDNVSTKIYEADESNTIRIEVTAAAPIFTGDFTVTAVAVDQVGNESVEVFKVTEFDLETQLERILAPHEPLFQCGESGILTIKTWGYVEKVEVEFPEEFTALNPDLDKTFVYEVPSYQQTEEVQFMVPLYMSAEGDYTITVRAYKGEKHLEDYPSLAIMEVEGTILDDIRTRLR